MPKPLDAESLERVQRALGYCFDKAVLLKRALTHRSASAEHMERLEFLGDAVLGLAIAEKLHARFPDYSEGELSRMRAALVRKEGLMKIAALWQLDDALHVGEGERAGGKLKSRSIAANAVEALIGAVFEDGGWDEAKELVLRAWRGQLDAIDLDSVRDAKSRLQEFTQGKGWGLPEYSVTDHGVGASPRFTARCKVNGQWLGEGAGSRKKAAELVAAERSWDSLSDSL